MASSLSSPDVEDQIAPEPASAAQESQTLDELEAELHSVLNQILAPELSGMMLHHQQPLLDAIAAIRHLRVYRATHPDEQAGTLNLGSANKEPTSSYSRLGLGLKVTQWQESHYNKMIESLVQRQLNERISEFWAEKYDFLIDKLKAYAKYMIISGAPAASGRLLFLLLESLYSEDLDLGPVVLPDMKLNVAPNDPVILSWTTRTGRKLTTLISGTIEIDYAFFAQESGSELRQAQSREEQEALNRIVPLHLEELIVNPTYLGLFKDDCFLQFTEYHEPKIVNKIPQTIAACLTIMQKTNKKQIAWCLTSGTEWTFGVVVDGPSRLCYLTEIIRLKLDEENNLKAIFMTLAYWGMSSCQDLIKLFA